MIWSTFVFIDFFYLVFIVLLDSLFLETSGGQKKIIETIFVSLEMVRELRLMYMSQPNT